MMYVGRTSEDEHQKLGARRWTPGADRSQMMYVGRTSEIGGAPVDAGRRSQPNDVRRTNIRNWGRAGGRRARIAANIAAERDADNCAPHPGDPSWTTKLPNHRAPTSSPSARLSSRSCLRSSRRSSLTRARPRPRRKTRQRLTQALAPARTQPNPPHRRGSPRRQRPQSPRCPSSHWRRVQPTQPWRWRTFTTTRRPTPARCFGAQTQRTLCQRGRRSTRPRLAGSARPIISPPTDCRCSAAARRVSHCRCSPTSTRSRSRRSPRSAGGRRSCSSSSVLAPPECSSRGTCGWLTGSARSSAAGPRIPKVPI